MATVQELKATARPKGGKGASRAARTSGRVPGVIYGDNKPPVAMVTLDHAELRKRIYAGRFLTTLYHVDVDGTKHRVIPRDFQLDAIKDLPLHVDFLRVAEGATIRVKVAVHVLNAEASPGVKRGGAVNIVTHTVNVECPAESIPESIDVDISDVDINHSKHLSDVKLPKGVRVLAQGDITLVTVVPPSGYAEELKAAAAAAAQPLPPLLLLLPRSRLRPAHRRHARSGRPRLPLPALRPPRSNVRLPPLLRRRREPENARPGIFPGRVFTNYSYEAATPIKPHAAFRRPRQSRSALHAATATISVSWRLRRSPRSHNIAPWRKRFQGVAVEGMIGGDQVLLLLPGTFVNESGRAVAEALSSTSSTSPTSVVLHDELELPSAKVRVKIGGGNAWP